MITIPYHLRAEERLILSCTSASAGQHETLDFVPGATLLGAFAGRVYGAWKSSHPDDVFLTFHSGAVCFGDALPVSSKGDPTLPVPLSWHYAKPTAASNVMHTRGISKSNCIVAEQVYNLSHSAWAFPKRQPVQMRDGWFTPSGQLIEVASSQVLKTARDTGRFGAPEEGKLFGYSFIEAGQEFSGKILVDDNAPHLADEIRKWIGGGRRIQLGRSHNAEFGKCLLSLAASADEAAYALATATRPDRITLFATSDLWFDGGLPDCGNRIHPKLKGYRLDPSRTFTRFRRYSPWNAFRGFPESERQVLCRGSVICLSAYESAPITTNLEELRSELEGGIGLGLTEGLGRVLVNPEMLQDLHPKFAAPRNDEPGKAPKGPPRPDSVILHGIEQRWTHRWVQLEADRLAAKYIEAWRDFRPRPRRSQWAQLRLMARAAVDPTKFSEDFARLTSSGAAKWKWGGTAHGTGNITIAEEIAAAWKNQAKSTDPKVDPRSEVPEARAQAFLAAVAEAARRLSDQ